MSSRSNEFFYNVPPPYFNGKNLPSYNVYRNTFEKDFLRYLYYQTVMGSSGDYPLGEFDSSKLFQLGSTYQTTPRISKILVGEAPPKNYSKYFYNPKGIWPNGSPWKSEVSKVLFGNKVFFSKLDFLIACSQSGFLLVDLFPYAIKYTSRTSKKYENACISAFLGNSPYNIMYTLNLLTPLLSKNLVFGFGLTGLGNSVLNDHACNVTFTNWASKNNVTLYAGGTLNFCRTDMQSGYSQYLRICHRRLKNNFGPYAPLLKKAGF